MVARLLLLALLCSVAWSLIVVDVGSGDPALLGYRASPVVHRFGRWRFRPFNGTVLPPIGYPDPSPIVTGAIVLVPAEGARIGNGCEAKCRWAAQNGAIGCIIMSEVPAELSGFSDIVWNECCPSDVQIPVVELGLFQTVPYLEHLGGNGSYIIVTLTDDDPNPWREFVVEGSYHIYFPACWLVISTCVLILSLYKTYGYYYYRGPELTTGFLFLVIESFCNFERFMFFLIDPMFTHQVFPHIALSIIYTFTYPLSLITSLLITLAWFEIMQSTKNLHVKPPTFLRYSRIPFIVVCVALMIAEIVSSALRGLMHNVGTLIVVVWTTYGAIGIMISIVFFYFGFKILAITKAYDLQSSMNKTTKNLMWSGVFLVCLSILLLISASPLHFSSLPMWLCAHNLTMVFVFAISVTQLLAMPDQRPRDKLKETVNTATEQPLSTEMDSKSHDSY